jgi:hypothetical protein
MGSFWFGSCGIAPPSVLVRFIFSALYLATPLGNSLGELAKRVPTARGELSRLLIDK